MLRSDPPGQYLAPNPLLSYDTPFDEVKWSRLLGNEAFHAASGAIAKRWGWGWRSTRPEASQGVNPDDRRYADMAVTPPGRTS